MSLVPWSDDRVRFEKELKPAMARLIRQVLPEYRLVRAEQRFEVGPDGGNRVLLVIEFSDDLAHMALEDKA